MNRNSHLYKSIVLALAATALTGKVTLAEDLPRDDVAAEKFMIVLAKASGSKAIDNFETSGSDDGEDLALQEALHSILADSKMELETRLLDHKSINLTADQ